MTADVSGRVRAPRSAATASHEPRCEARRRFCPAMIEIAGGVEAPARARRWVLSCLPGEPIGPAQGDVAVIVSELVTNSVVHAHADSSQLLKITVAELEGRLRIAVTDHGSETVPHLRDVDDDRPGGLGLHIIDRLCLGWGVIRNGAGSTEVWCEVASAGELA
jgi:Histidine kinase-like ATPase domain